MELQQTLEIQFEEPKENTKIMAKSKSISYLGNTISVSEANTERIFRSFYGSTTFIEKSAIPSKYGFVSKKGTSEKGYPDFFIDKQDYVIIVEAKADDFESAKSEVIFYTLHNAIKKRDIFAIAISGQSELDYKAALYLKMASSSDVEPIIEEGKLQSLDYIEKLHQEKQIGELISTEALNKTLKSLNETFQKMNIKDTERSLFFSGLMIALKDDNFINIYKSIQEPSSTDIASKHYFKAHHLNEAILMAIENQISSKINNYSKEYNWKDRFSFIKTIDYPIEAYKKVISLIEQTIFYPFKYNEKLDILGKAYKIFLSRAGKIENKNIILTPDHIKSLMIDLARLDVDDVLIDTCTGSGGFLMEGMEKMIQLAHNDESKISRITEKQLIGFELDSTLFALACSNMFLHGDGRTNLIYHSSILEQGSELFNYIKSLKPTKCVINPPYENNNPILFTKIALQLLEKNGKLIIIMPTPTLNRNIGGDTDDILRMAKLDFVIKMPYNIFSEQKRTVNTSIFGFTKTKHREDDEVIFYTMDDDGLVSVQHKGRIDKYHKWAHIRQNLIDCIMHNKCVDTTYEKRLIYREHVLNCYGYPKKDDNQNLIPFGELFSTSERGTLQSENAEEGEYDFITASEEIKKHNTYTDDKEAIVYAIAAGGSLGRCHYVNGKFIASNLCLVLTPKDSQKYPINMLFYAIYLNSIRSKVVAEVSDGTSKLTLDPNDLRKYPIQYVDIKIQNQIAREYQDTILHLKAELEKKNKEFCDKFTNILA